jgi:hypothetical protein
MLNSSFKAAVSGATVAGIDRSTGTALSSHPIFLPALPLSLIAIKKTDTFIIPAVGTGARVAEALAVSVALVGGTTAVGLDVVGVRVDARVGVSLGTAVAVSMSGRVGTILGAMVLLPVGIGTAPQPVSKSAPPIKIGSDQYPIGERIFTLPLNIRGSR